ncbi:MAG: nucleotide exchange factor GrpE [Terriglobia bacterium]
MRDAPDPKMPTADEARESPASPNATGTLPLEEQLKQLETEKKNLYDQLLRRQADFENFRKRIEREQQEFRQAAEADLLNALLPVIDAFERALAVPTPGNDEDYRKGVELIYRELLSTLNRAGLKAVEAVGRAFDPFLHHAVERVETPEHPDQYVLAELQRGYTLKGRLLRPALVRVAVHPAPSGDAGESNQADASHEPADSKD